jgi:AcrR family transcriptional regulator
MGAAVAQRSALNGARAQRIIEAMRESVAELGIAGSTFERVAERAGVSHGLLHYHFGTKERLLVEVIRRDTEARVVALDAALSSASTPDEILGGLFAMHESTMTEQQGYVYMVSELFIAARYNPEVARELGEMYRTARVHFADLLRRKEAEGVVKLRFDAEAVVSFLFSAGDGTAAQRLTDPSYDPRAAGQVAYEALRHLLQDPD